MRIQFQAGDDYGVAVARAVIWRPGDMGEEGQKETIELPLPLPRTGRPGDSGKKADTSPDREISTHDLTAHPWAGLPVAIQLEAADDREQVGKSGIVEMTLPERIFIHPVARAIIEERKKLVTPTLAVREEVINTLAEIARQPAAFFDDTVVFLALRIAQGRLVFERTTQGVASVQRLLWDIALRIEDGELSLARRELMEVQKKLMEAMEGKADNQEVERLMDELQQALDKYLEALRKELAARGFQEPPPNLPMEILQSDELQRMIDEARDLARAGAMEAAREMLARLKEMLENIQAGLQPGQPRQDIQQAMKLMDGLRSLTKEQQQLLDKTFKQLQGRQNQPEALNTPQPGNPPGTDAGKQESLRYDLGEIMRQLGDLMGLIPDPLGKAERAMRGAAQALDQNQPAAAVPLQTEALRQLGQAMEGVAEALARRMGGMVGVGKGRSGAQPGKGRDPFGRRQDGALGSMVNGTVQIPDRMERRRVREILRELRRRAGERQRPRPEREYIQRLLRQF